LKPVFLNKKHTSNGQKSLKRWMTFWW